MKNLKSNIGWLIEKSNYNRRYFSKRYNKSANTISNWCTGKAYPSVPILFDLAEHLGVSIGELYEIVDTNEKKPFLDV